MFQSILGKKIEEIRIRTGAEFLPKIEPPPPQKKTHWLNPLLFLNIGVQWQM